MYQEDGIQNPEFKKSEGGFRRCGAGFFAYWFLQPAACFLLPVAIAERYCQVRLDAFDAV